MRVASLAQAMSAATAFSSNVRFLKGSKVTSENEYDWPGIAFASEFVCGCLDGVGPCWGDVELRATSTIISSYSWSETSGGHFFNFTILTSDGIPLSSTLFSTEGSKAGIAKSYTAVLPVRLEANGGRVVFSANIAKRTEFLFGTVKLVDFDLDILPSGSSMSGLKCNVPFSSPLFSGLPPERPRRKIEFIGDSISAGYGIEGTPPCGFSGSDENVFEGWTWGVVRGLEERLAVGFDVATTARSGIGVYRNYADEPTPTMTQLWPSILGNVPTGDVQPDEPAFVPDDVFILLGCNDFSTEPVSPFSDFSRNFNVLLDKIFDQYLPYNPDLFVMVSCGPSDQCCYENSQARVVSNRNDSRVAFETMRGSIPAETYPGQYYGCAGHPNVAAAKLMANTMLNSLSKYDRFMPVA